ncbi:MAG TPA: DUF3000 family protein [Mycobacteriales bacterium]|nr:DUF3000 family protein [Mycobacteriales bacterium]
MTLLLEPAPAPEEFALGLVSLQAVLDGPARRGLTLRTVPAPKRMAPWSFAVAAEVSRDGEDDEVASGRFIVLHDPDSQDGWHGSTRVVALVEAQVEAEMAADAALADVGWSWLVEALEVRGVAHTAAGGTVTRTVSTRFGVLEGEDACQVEVRASWTALPGPGGLELGGHLLAWCDLLCSTAGLPPDGVVALHPRQG